MTLAGREVSFGIENGSVNAADFCRRCDTVNALWCDVQSAESVDEVLE